MGTASVVLPQDRNELYLINHSIGKWGSLFLFCHPLGFRSVSFNHSMTHSSYTLSVRVQVMRTDRGPEAQSVGNRHRATPKGRQISRAELELQGPTPLLTKRFILLFRT